MLHPGIAGSYLGQETGGCPEACVAEVAALGRAQSAEGEDEEPDLPHRSRGREVHGQCARSDVEVVLDASQDSDPANHCLGS